MKKILSLVAVVLIASGFAHANGTTPTSPVGIAVVKAGNIVKLFYRAEKTGKVKVTIYNDEGDKVFVETMANREHFMRPYNFSLLPEGKYTIEIADMQGKRYQKVDYSLPGNARSAHLTRFGTESKYMLAVPDAGSDALTVKIFDEGDNLVYEETEAVEGDFAKIYNLNKVGGNHTFEVIDEKGNANRLSKPLQK